MKTIIKTISPAGFEMLFETPDVADREKLLTTLANFEDQLLEAGYTPAPSSHPAMAPAAAAPPSTAAASFLVDSITATVADGKAYWRVKGGEFQKWGVIVYPEVLAAADLADLNPLKPYTEAGLTAYYSTKDDGKPKKITRLERR